MNPLDELRQMVNGAGWHPITLWGGLTAYRRLSGGRSKARCRVSFSDETANRKV